MSVLFAGNSPLQEWIEPLVSLTLVGSDDDSVETGEADGRVNTLNTKATRDSAKIVQVVSIGRLEAKDDRDHGEDKGNQFLIDGNDDNIGRKSQAALNAPSDYEYEQRQQRQRLRNVPTSLLISDGRTSILAILSTETRIGLNQMARDDSLSQYEANTISRGCIIKISSFRLDTLASSFSFETSGGNDERCVVPTKMEAKVAYEERMQLLKDDPLLRDHASLLHHKYSQHSNISLPEFVIVANVVGPIEVIGGHGLAIVGRPSYVMDTVDVRRAVQSLSMGQFSSKIAPHCDAIIPANKKKRKHSSSTDAEKGRISQTKHIVNERRSLDRAFNIRELQTMEQPMAVVRRVTMNSVEVFNIEHPSINSHSSSNSLKTTDEELPIGNVTDLLFGSPTVRSSPSIDAIWRDTTDSGGVTAYTASIPTTKNGAIIEESISSKHGTNANDMDTSENTAAREKRKGLLQKSADVQEVLSDDYSSSSEEEDMCITNMLLSEDDDDDEDDDQNDDDRKPAYFREKQTNNGTSGDALNSKQIFAEAVSFESYNGEEVYRTPEVEEPVDQDEPLENQPIHPVIIESKDKNDSAGNVPDVNDDDISINDDETSCEDLLRPLVQTQEEAVSTIAWSNTRGENQRTVELLTQPFNELIPESSTQNSPSLLCSSHSRDEKDAQSDDGEENFHDAVQNSEDIKETSSDLLLLPQTSYLQTQEAFTDSNGNGGNSIMPIVDPTGCEKIDTSNSLRRYDDDDNETAVNDTKTDPLPYSFEVATFERWMCILTSTMKSYIDETSSSTVVEPLTIDEGVEFLFGGDKIRDLIRNRNM